MCSPVNNIERVSIKYSVEFHMQGDKIIIVHYAVYFVSRTQNNTQSLWGYTLKIPPVPGLTAEHSDTHVPGLTTER